MQFVGKMITSVSEFYKDINPSTLSGAIDVLVVEDAQTGQLACSPFHVRFGKLQLLRPQEKVVEMRVNGRLVEVQMKVGEAGETFFVLPSAKAVAEEWATSPLARPLAAAGSPVEPLSLSPVKGAGTLLMAASSDQEGEEDYQDPFRRRRLSGSLGRSLLPKSPPSAAAAALQDSPTDASPGPMGRRGGALSDSELEMEPSHSAIAGDVLPPIADAILDITATTTTTPSLPLPVGSPPKYSWMWGGLPQRAPKSAMLASDEEIPPLAGEQRERDGEQGEGMATEQGDTENGKAHPPVGEDDPEIADLARAFAEHTIESGSSSGSSPATTDQVASSTEPGIIPSAAQEEGSFNVQASLADAQTTLADAQAPLAGDQTTLADAQTTLADAQPTLDDAQPTLADNATLATHSPTAPAADAAPKLVNIFDHVNQPAVFKRQYEALLAIPKEEPLGSIVIIKGAKPEMSDLLVDVSSDPPVAEMLRAIEPFTVRLEWAAFAEDPAALLAELTGCKTLVLVNETILFSGAVAQSLVLGRAIFGQCMSYEALLKKHPFLDPAPASSATAPVAPPAKRSSWRWWSRSPPVPEAEGSQPATPPNNKAAPPESAVLPAPPPTTAAAGILPKEPSPVYYAKSLRLPHEMLQKLDLQPGVNSISFTVTTRLQGRATCNARIFRWPSDSRIVISDVDGTITKSDALGHLFAFVGRDWTHSDIAKLYSAIASNGYHFLYLTSRSLGQANITRGYLRGVEQNGRFQLPDGPVIMSPDRLLAALRREVVLGNPQEFKIACLRDIQQLFRPPPDGSAGGSEAVVVGNPFWAGFGNRTNDAHAYAEIGIPPPRIFIVDPTGRVAVEPLVDQYSGSYAQLIELVDQIFPPIIRSPAPPPEEEVYNEFWYWRRPLTVVLGTEDVARLRDARAHSTDALSSLDGEGRRRTRAADEEGAVEGEEDELEEEEGLVPAYYV